MRSAGGWALVGDIGGTHARFALTPLDGPVPALRAERVYATAQFPTPAAAVRDYLQGAGAHPRCAVFAVAGPVAGDTARLTNGSWAFDAEDLRRALGLDAVRLINDFAAVAWAVPHFTERDLLPLQGAVRTPLQGSITLIGAGTGLGVALLTGGGATGWQTVPTEGGHSSFAPQDADQRRVHDWLQARYERVSNERVLSGAGLSAIDTALRGVSPQPPANASGLRSAAEVVAAAQAGEPAACHALAVFCSAYGAVAGDAALWHGARTVLVAGGMARHFAPFLQTSGFIEAFRAKGRQRAVMERMQVHVVRHPYPGLLGAAVVARAGVCA